MRKLLRGIAQFRRDRRPEYRDTFARLALGQSPDTLFVACSDSRVVPNLFASADPGDLFVVRNVGNLIAPSGRDGLSVADESEVAAIEFAVERLKVTDIIICGHSECGAMGAILQGLPDVPEPHLKSWLRHGLEALEGLKKGAGPDPSLPRHNQLSQLNVLTQLKHLETYAFVRERMRQGRLRLHGWWFDIAQADVLYYEPAEQRFKVIDAAVVEQLLKRLDGA